MQLIADDVAFAYPTASASKGMPPDGARLHNAWGEGRLTRYENASVERLMPDTNVFSRVSFTVSRGMRLGIVGENGSGKSTLVRELAGELEPTAGEVRRIGSLTLVPQEFPTDTHQTIGGLVNETLANVRALAAELEAAAAALSAPHHDPTQPQVKSSDPDHHLADLILRAEYSAAWDADRRLTEALTRLNAPTEHHGPLAELSVGKRYRVRLACKLAEGADFLVLDEPTNHLDEGGIAYLTAQIAKWPGGVVLVTHDRQLLDDVATAILDLDPAMDGRPTLYGQGGYAGYRRAKAQALQRWRLRYQAEQRRAAVLMAQRDRAYEGLSDEWRPPKGSQKHRRATRARGSVKAADRLVAQLEAKAVKVPTPPLVLNFPPLPKMIGANGVDLPDYISRHPARNTVESQDLYAAPFTPYAHIKQNAYLIEVTDPYVGSDAKSNQNNPKPARLSLPNTTIPIQPGGKLLVTGPNGAGKSTLLSVIAGDLSVSSGTRKVAAGLRIGYLRQDDAPYPPKVTGFQAIEQQVLKMLSRGELDPKHVYPIASFGLLTEEELDRPLSELSAGQQRRFALAQLLVTAPQLLILDEPTNHLSIDLVDELTIALKQTDAAIVIATHDRRLIADLDDWPTLNLG